MEKLSQLALVYLFATHKLDDVVLNRFRVLRDAVKDTGDVFLLFHKMNDEIAIPEDVNCYSFTIDSLNTLNYIPIAETLIPGSNHFPLFLFYKDYPQYECYWYIEYDVLFTGNWNTFFNAFSSIKVDFLSSHIQRIDENPRWFWWQTLKLETLEVPLNKYIRSFNPVYRISNDALSFLDDILSHKNKGHHEVLIPTLLNYCGYTITDISGNGSFVLPEFKNQFYLGQDFYRSDELETGTMRFRPVFKLKEIEQLNLSNKLFHPVK